MLFTLAIGCGGDARRSDQQDGREQAQAASPTLADEFIKNLRAPPENLFPKETTMKALQPAIDWFRQGDARWRSLLCLMASRSRYRRTAGAIATLVDPTKASDCAMRTLLDENFEGGPYTLGYVIFWTSETPAQALSAARRLLESPFPRARVAGHMIAAFSTLQARPPVCIDTGEAYDDPRNPPTAEVWRDVLAMKNPSMADLTRSTARFIMKDKRQRQNMNEHESSYRSRCQGGFLSLLGGIAGVRAPGRIRNAKSEEELESILAEARHPLTWKAVKDLNHILFLSDYYRPLWPPRSR